MELDIFELQAWEDRQRKKDLERTFPTPQKKKHPREEALRDHRHHRPGGHWYCKETAFVRKMTQRVFRRKMKRELWNEIYYRTRPRDYKTYGYLTW